MDEYLLPMDSLQSLNDPTVPGAARLPPPQITIDPEEDINRQKAANKETEPSKRKKKDAGAGGSHRGKSGAPSRPALDHAFQNIQSPGPRATELDPRYHAFPPQPKGSWSKSTGAKIRRAAPPIPDHMPQNEPPPRPRTQHGPLLDPESSVGRSSGSGVLAAAAAAGGHSSEQPPPALKPRRHPNPFRKDSIDDDKKHQYVNLPDDSQVNAFANV